MLSDGNGKLHYTSIDGYENFREKRVHNQLRCLFDYEIFAKEGKNPFYMLSITFAGLRSRCKVSEQNEKSLSEATLFGYI